MLSVPAQAAGRCDVRKGERVLRENRLVRLFEGNESRFEGVGKYACAKRSGRVHWLAYPDVYGSFVGRLAGPYVAYLEPYVAGCKADCPPGHVETEPVIVLNVLTGRARSTSEPMPVTALHLTAGGTAAFVAPAGRRQRSVRVLTRWGTRTLDTGAIASRSVRLRGRRLSWVRDGVPRTATLDR